MQNSIYHQNLYHNQFYNLSQSDTISGSVLNFKFTQNKNKYVLTMNYCNKIIVICKVFAYWLFPLEEQGLSWVSHHQQTALITPMSLIKNTHLCLCPCVQHMMSMHYQTVIPTHLHVSACRLLYVFLNCNAKWKWNVITVNYFCLNFMCAILQ